MKYIKYIAITTLLVFGISFPSCDDDGLNCNCPPETFFDVQDLEVVLYQDANLGLPISNEETVEFNDGKYIHLDYIVDYHTTNTPKWDWSFSLINIAYACSCAVGSYQSKTEELVSLSITTLNDFDDEHLANSDITDLLLHQGFYIDGEYIDENTNQILSELIPIRLNQRLMGEDMVLKLTKAPELNSEFKIKISMELSTGETYEVESHPIFITL